MSEQVRPSLHLDSDLVQGEVAVAHGDDESLPGKEEDLAEPNAVRLVLGRLEDDEQGLAVDLELRPLVRLDGILDGELVEAELASDRFELLLGRLVEPDPGEAPLLAARLVGLLEGDVAGVAVSVHVDGAVDDHRTERNAATSSAVSSRDSPGRRPSVVRPA